MKMIEVQLPQDWFQDTKMVTISEFWDQTFSWVGTRETENNAYAKFWGDKQRALWYVMVFSVVVNF